MKIYLVTNVGFPYGMASANRIRCYAKALMTAGVDAEVIIYRRTERFGVRPQNVQARGVCEGVPFRYMSESPIRENSKAKRLCRDYVDKAVLISFLRRSLLQGDVIFLYNGFDVEFNIFLTNYAHRKGWKVVYELCELPYGTGRETGKAIRKRNKVIHGLFPRLDGIIPISEALEVYAAPYLSEGCSMCRVPIMVDYSRYSLEDLSASEPYHYIFHSGSLFEQKDGVLGMIEAFGLAQDRLSDFVRFIFTGKKESSPHQAEIDGLIEKYYLQDKIEFTGFLSEKELRDYLQRASLVIINKYRTQQNKYCFSTKLGEYMAAGKPIIITRVGEAERWLTDKIDACLVEPENVSALANSIVQVFNSPDMAQSLGATARETCKNKFDYRVYANMLKSFFEGI